MYEIPSNTFTNIDALVSKVNTLSMHIDNAVLPLERTRLLIRIMERVKALGGGVNMCTWYSTADGNEMLVSEAKKIRSAEQHHACGNQACFAGWVALSPEWKEFFDRKTEPTGSNMARFWINDRTLDYSLSGVKVVEDFVFGDLTTHGPTKYVMSRFYNKPWSRIDIDDVLTKLREVEARTIASRAFFS